MIFYIIVYSDFMLYKGIIIIFILFLGFFFLIKMNDLGMNDLGMNDFFVDVVGIKFVLIVEVCMWLVWCLGLYCYCKFV